MIQIIKNPRTTFPISTCHKKLTMFLKKIERRGTKLDLKT